jgi:flagellin
MALTVNTNMASLTSLNNLNGTNRKLTSTLGRISSGLRINKAADDAAGLAVAENLDAQGRSLEQAIRNTNDGVAVIQTAEGATFEVQNILKRMRELAVQSSSETLDDGERAFIQDEYEQLAQEVDRIALVTNFNGVNLADGSAATLDVQVGIFNTGNDRIAITLGDLTATNLAVDTATLDFSSAANAQSAINALDVAIDSVNTMRSDYGAVQNRLESSLANLETYHENLVSAESNIRDADFAKEAAEMAKYQTMQQAGIAILGQANTITQAAVQLIG